MIIDWGEETGTDDQEPEIDFGEPGIDFGGDGAEIDFNVDSIDLSVITLEGSGDKEAKENGRQEAAVQHMPICMFRLCDEVIMR